MFNEALTRAKESIRKARQSHLDAKEEVRKKETSKNNEETLIFFDILTR
jgi:hypothetical protein